MPYDKDGKYFRKPVFNENFKGLKNKKPSDKASNIENNEKLEDYEYLKKFYEVNKNKTENNEKLEDYEYLRKFHDELIKNKTENKKSKSNSSLPPWLPLITIPFIFFISTSINNSRNQQTQPPVQPPTTGDRNLDICQLCRINNSCDTLPQCTTKQRKCEWKQNWDGKLIEECRSF